MDLDSTRDWMIRHQIRPWNVADERVLDTLATIRREDFVPEAYRAFAFADVEIPLPQHQHMLKPILEGRLLQALQLNESHEVLVVGTGSGYLSACVAALAGNVTAIDIHEELTNHAHTAMALAKLGNTRLITADFNEFTPDQCFDRILLTGSLPLFDARLPEWLTPDGLLLLPTGTAPNMAFEAVTRTANHYQRLALFETLLPALENVPQPAAFHF